MAAPERRYFQSVVCNWYTPGDHTSPFGRDDCAVVVRSTRRRWTRWSSRLARYLERRGKPPESYLTRASRRLPVRGIGLWLRVRLSWSLRPGAPQSGASRCVASCHCFHRHGRCFLTTRRNAPLW